MSEKLSSRKQCRKTCASLWWRFPFPQNVPSEIQRVWNNKIIIHLWTFITAMFSRVYSALSKRKPRKHFHWSKLSTENLPLICCMNGEISFGSHAALVEFHNLSRLSQLSLHWLTLESKAMHPMSKIKTTPLKSSSGGKKIFVLQWTFML